MPGESHGPDCDEGQVENGSQIWRVGALLRPLGQNRQIRKDKAQSPECVNPRIIADKLAENEKQGVY